MKWRQIAKINQQNYSDPFSSSIRPALLRVRFDQNNPYQKLQNKPSTGFQKEELRHKNY